MRAAAAAQALRLALRCSSLRTLAPSWEACSTSASVDSQAQMARLLPAFQQRAGFAAGRGIDTESIEDGLASPKSPRRPKSKSRPKPAQGPGPAPKAESETQRRARQERMRLLLQDEASSGRKGEAARAFVAKCVGTRGNRVGMIVTWTTLSGESRVDRPRPPHRAWRWPVMGMVLTMQHAIRQPRSLQLTPLSLLSNHAASLPGMCTRATPLA